MGTNINNDDYLLPDEGIIMSSGNTTDFCMNDKDDTTKQWNTVGDDDLDAMIYDANSPFAKTYDACVIEFEFKCEEHLSNMVPEVSFEYIFASEEYYEYVDSEYNDVFGFFLNGENIALLPDGTTEVTINNVNYHQNQQYFLGNDPSTIQGVVYPLIEADGFTTKLIAKGQARRTGKHPTCKRRHEEICSGERHAFDAASA